MIKTIKYKIVFALARFYQFIKKPYCWTSMVMWAEYDNDDNWFNMSTCYEDMNKTGICYCGKERKQ